MTSKGKSKLNRLLSIYAILLVAFICLNCSENEKNDRQASYLFNEVPVEISNVDFKNQITEDANHNIINYIYFYNGGGVAVGDVDNDGLADIYFVSNQGENKLFRNKGDLKFEDISSSLGTSSTASWNTGATMVDINGDGYLDIYVCAVTGLLDFKGHNELFINNGDGSFSEKSEEYGLDYKGFSTQSYFFDYDKDGDLDVYIVNHAIHTTLSHGPAEARNKRVPLVGDALLKNENGKFIDVSEEANIFGGINGYGLSASIADFNNDGWDDIYVCNDFHEDDYYYINNQDGTFKETLDDSFSTISRFSMGSDAADVNNDGLTDLITLDMLPGDERNIKESEGDDAMLNVKERLSALGYKDQYSRNMLQINHSGNFFSEASILHGVSSTDWSWAPLIADFDNDGVQDLYVTNGILRRPNHLDFKQYISNAFKGRNPEAGMQWLYKSIDDMPSGKVPNQIFRGNGKRFVDETGTWVTNTPTLSNGAAYADLDLDGDLDLVTNNLNDFARIYENTSDSLKNFLNVKLAYKDRNREAIGAKIRLFAGEKVQHKSIYKSRGFLSSLESSVHFGLDTISKIDSVQIIWPDLTSQTVINPDGNQTLSIDYAPSGNVYGFDEQEILRPAYFQTADAIDFTHDEDSFIDEYRERLIPYKVSKRGPALAIADIDGNGYDDVYLGGAAGQEAALFLNNGNTFSKKHIPEIKKDIMFEDNDALFFDCDGDGDLDLYVASGVISLNKKEYYGDRLYRNDKGEFKQSESIPFNGSNTSVVISSDYDLDGDLDLFVGNLSNPSDFGSPVKSMLLQNDGNGNFSVEGSFELNARVNDAIWEDIDQDGREDLLIAAEWDKPRIFMNLDQGFKEVDIAENTEGLWQAIGWYDVDGDGDKDVVLGNWGLNTKLSLNSGPLHMYHNDFDNDGKNEVLVAYPIDGNYYPISSKDELGSQMKSISKKFVSYSDFALKTIEELVGDEVLKSALKYEVQELASGYLENDSGSFGKFVPFVDELQVAPINSFSEITIEGEKQLLISGNSFRVNTYHGGYSSLKGMLFKSNDAFEMLSEYGVPPLSGQIKATATIQMKNKNLLLVVENDADAKTFFFPK